MLERSRPSSPPGMAPRQRREVLGLAPGDTDPFFDGSAGEQAENQPVRHRVRRAAQPYRTGLHVPRQPQDCEQAAWSMPAVLCTGATVAADFLWRKLA